MTDDAAYHLLIQQTIGDLADAMTRQRVAEAWEAEWITGDEAMWLLGDCELTEAPRPLPEPIGKTPHG